MILFFQPFCYQEMQDMTLKNTNFNCFYKRAIFIDKFAS